MQIKYYPKVDDNWNKIREFATAVLLPDNYDATREYPWLMAVHGIGETGEGSQAQLENLVLGVLQPDGKRLWAFVTDEMKMAVDKYGIIMFIPTYPNFFEPTLANFVYDFGRASFSIAPKMVLSGFSLGGGAVVKYITSTLANANRVALAIPCAPTYAVGDATVVGKANLPVHFFVNVNDTNGPTNLSVTKNSVNAINATSPVIKVQFTAFDKTGHGGFSEAMTISPPIAPGGQGIINLSESVYEAYLGILKNGPRQMKSGVTIPPTTQPPAPSPILIANAGGDQTVNLPIAFLDGTKSVGYKSAQWKMKQAPAGVHPDHPVVESGGWITTKLNFPKEGTYVITLRVFSGANYTGTLVEDDVVVNYTTSGTPPAKIVLQKVYIPKTGKYVYVYDDGSTETKDQ